MHANVNVVIAKLKVLQASEEQEEKDIASYLVNAFFEEYRFFAKYPETELIITATFLGMAINQGILSGKFKILGMKVVLDSINVRPLLFVFFFFWVSRNLFLRVTLLET